MTDPPTRVIQGEPVSPSDLERLEAWSAYTDPLKSLTRLDGYAKWVLGGNTLVLTLAAGLAATMGLSTMTTVQLWLFGLAVLALGVSWTGAATGLAPAWVAFNPESPDDTEAAFATVLARRRTWLRLATVFFGLALLLAGMVPVGKQFRDDPAATPVYAGITYDIDDSATLTATLQTSGLLPHSPVTIALIANPAAPEISLPSARALTDNEGKSSTSLRLRRIGAVKGKLQVVATWPTPALSRDADRSYGNNRARSSTVVTPDSPR